MFKKIITILILSSITKTNPLYSQLSVKASLNVMKMLGISPNNLGGAIGAFYTTKKNEKISYDFNLDFYKKCKYEYSVLAKSNDPMHPDLDLQSTATLNYFGTNFSLCYYLTGSHDGDFNVYPKLNVSVIKVNYLYTYEQYDSFIYEFSGIDDLDDQRDGGGDLYLGLGIGIEKRINLVGVFIEANYLRGILNSYINYDPGYFKPFGNNNTVKFNFGFRIIT